MSTATFRILIVLTCYGLSGFGVIAAILGLPMIFSSAGSLPSAIVVLVWLSAISALFKMSLAWVQNINLGKKYSRHAFIFGVCAILVIPIFSLPQAFEAPMQEAFVRLLALVAIQVILALPAIILAGYLNRFHAT